MLFAFRLAGTAVRVNPTLRSCGMDGVRSMVQLTRFDVSDVSEAELEQRLQERKQQCATDLSSE